MTTATEAWQAWQAARAARAEARVKAQQSVITGRPIGERVSAFAAEEQALKAAEAARREYYAIIGIA